MAKSVLTLLILLLCFDVTPNCNAWAGDQTGSQIAIPATDPGIDNNPYFPKPAYFRKNFAQAPTRVDLEPPVQIEDYVVGGKLELSLKSYLALVMANNSDISIQRLSVQLSRNTLAGSFGMFDPTATASFNSFRSLTGTVNATSGAQTLNQLTQPLSLGVQQLLPSGAFYNLNFVSNKLSSNSSFATVNPSFSTGLTASVTQPLLRGRGAYLTKIPIMLARSRLRAADYNLQDQLVQFVTSAEMAYWDVVGARENVRVAEESLKLADTALKRAERELELGASSPLDIFQPQQNFANSQLVLAQTQFGLTVVEDALRRQMGADLDPKYRAMPLELTESIEPALPPGALDREQMVEQALSHRQDLKVARQALDIDNLNIQQTNDALRPNLSLSLQYGSSGTGGNLYVRSDAVGGGSQIVSVVPGGIGDALSQLFGFSLPTYGFGLTLQLPIKNRTATANLANATVNKKLDALRVRSNEENIRLQVLTAVTNVENSKASVALAKTARDLSLKRVDADKKKYELGAEVIFFVLQAQNDLTTAESALVRETINLRRNQLTLLQRVGTLLEERGIAVQ
jgi:outer membrane protein